MLAVALAFVAGCATEPPPGAASAPTPTAAPEPSPGSDPPPTPAATAPPSGRAGRPVPPSRAAARPARAHRYAFPVRGRPASYGTTHSGYPATDIFADCGRPVVAVTDGVVLEVSRVDRYDPRRDDPALRGGMAVSLLGDDGVRYYGSHLSAVTSGVRAGVRVRVGQRIGSVGHTGRASGVCHLHFGVSAPCARAGDWWIRRGVINPARFLDAWRAGRALSPAATVTAWRRANGCPPEP
jgi:murein DD-endopeptidase MepM/ murein hydrolase activator NlpD